MATTPNFGFTLLEPSQDGAEIVVNEALLAIDALLTGTPAGQLRQITFQVVGATSGGPKARHVISDGFTITRVQVFSIEDTTIEFDLRRGDTTELLTSPSPSSIVGSAAPALTSELYADINVGYWTTLIPDDSYIDLYVTSGSGNATVLIEGMEGL